MTDNRKDGAVDPRQTCSSEAEINRYRADRQRPKAIARPLADKMARPAAARGYETK